MRARDHRFLCDFPVEILLPEGEAWATIHDVAIGGGADASGRLPQYQPWRVHGCRTGSAAQRCYGQNIPN